MVGSFEQCNGFFNHDATVPVGQGLLIIEDSRSHSDTPHSVGLLWTSDQPDLPDNTQNSKETNFHAPAGFEPTISAKERPQTHTVDRGVTGMGSDSFGFIRAGESSSSHGDS